MRSTYKIINEEYPYFITSTIINWLNVFTSEKYFQMMLDNLRFYQNQYKIDIIAFVIIHNHFHMICNSKELRKAIQVLKSYTAKEILKYLVKENKETILNELKKNKSEYKTESDFQVWQECHHPLQIKDYEMLKQKIEYIHNNPVKKKLAINPEDWKYSSAAYYLKGEACGLKISPY